MVSLPACTKEGNGNNTGTDGEVSGDYVDLGLSSGTKWKATNEKNPADAEYDFFTFDEAVATFGNKLPSRVQCEELISSCEWTWQGNGYKVVGPNGKFIILPASGYQSCEGNVDAVGMEGGVWSSESIDDSYARSLGFAYFDGFSDINMGGARRCTGSSVRLVQ